MLAGSSSSDPSSGDCRPSGSRCYKLQRKTGSSETQGWLQEGSEVFPGGRNVGKGIPGRGNSLEEDPESRNAK